MPHIGARWRYGSNRRHLVRRVTGPPPHGTADAGWRVRIMTPGWRSEESWPIPHGENGAHRLPPPPFGLGELVQLGEGGGSVSRWGAFAGGAGAIERELSGPSVKGSIPPVQGPCGRRPAVADTTRFRHLGT
jgi:hypothetical protein